MRGTVQVSSAALVCLAGLTAHCGSGSSGNAIGGGGPSVTRIPGQGGAVDMSGGTSPGGPLSSAGGTSSAGIDSAGPVTGGDATAAGAADAAPGAAPRPGTLD